MITKNSEEDCHENTGSKTHFELLHSHLNGRVSENYLEGEASYDLGPDVND